MHVDVVAVHGFPLDWNHWTIHEWPDKIDEVRAVTRASALGVRGRRLHLRRRGGAGVRTAADRRAADRPRRPDSLVQPVRSAARLAGDDAAPRSGRLVVLPALLHGTAARGRHAEAGARGISRSYTPDLGICQWFHFEDPRLDDAVRWLKRLGVTHLRTGPELGRLAAPERGRAGSTG